MSEQRFGCVWDAIEGSPVEAANMKARASLMSALRETVAGWKVTKPRLRGVFGSRSRV